MSSNQRITASGGASKTCAGLLSAATIAALLAGCSADLGRLDLGSASFNSNAPRQRMAPVPSEPLRGNGSSNLPDSVPPPPDRPYSYNPGPGAAPEPVRQAGLPEPVGLAPPSRDYGLPPRREPVSARRVPVSEPVAASRRGTIEVVQGDTLYGLSRKHRVSISELMSANDLKTPMIRPGQTLVLPGAGRRQPARRPEVASARTRPEPASAPPVASRLPPPQPVAPIAASEPAPDSGASGWTGTHTVTPRDSLYAIAKRYNVRVAELQEVNGITHPNKMRAGTVLKVPGSRAAGEIPVAQASEPVSSASPSQPLGGGDQAFGTTNRPTIINAADKPERVAAVQPPTPVMNDAAATAPPVAKSKAAASTAGPTSFRWPAKGRVIAKFGPRPDATHNDGINILVPLGSEVVAAEKGVVAYAGSELKGYGNLVLIRHEGNWVSAYAHNDAILVKRGDKVERGQAIAKAGKTGSVDQPQVHFELRQGSKPVDPMPHLER